MFWSRIKISIYHVLSRVFKISLQSSCTTLLENKLPSTEYSVPLFRVQAEHEFIVRSTERGKAVLRYAEGRHFVTTIATRCEHKEIKKKETNTHTHTHTHKFKNLVTPDSHHISSKNYLLFNFYFTPPLIFGKPVCYGYRACGMYEQKPGRFHRRCLE